MASCVELIPNARLYMRPIQLHLLAFWRPSSLDLEVSIPVTQHLKCHLQWWLNPLNTMKGRPLQPIHKGVTITTDQQMLQNVARGALGKKIFSRPMVRVPAETAYRLSTTIQYNTNFIYTVRNTKQYNISYE